MPEPVDAWWARRRWSRGLDVPYPVGTYREAWASFPVLIRQYHPDLNRGITLTQVPPAADVLLTWQCDVGHVFVATPEEQRRRPGREPPAVHGGGSAGWRSRARTRHHHHHPWRTTVTDLDDTVPFLDAAALEAADPTAPALDALRLRLADRAEVDGALDVGFTTIDSPVGPLLLAATERGLIRVAYSREDHDTVLGDLAQRLGPRILRAPKRLDQAARELDEYFAGRRRSFDLPLDRRLSTGFRDRVQRLLPDIPYGSTRTYREVAETAGSPAATRAVGTACSTNPLPVVIPCHRVLRSDGTLGGYIGGLAAKTTLLELEGRI
nr:methylated-DNA--[protein]-cysteine S-methyltransferase [Clavibacter phaseoli]